MPLSLNDYQDRITSIEIVEIFEEASAASTTTAGVSNPDAKSITSIKRDKFLGHTCFELAEECYYNLMKGKVPFKRWTGYIPDENIRNEVQKEYYKSKRLLVRNEKTGAMAYVK